MKALSYLLIVMLGLAPSVPVMCQDGHVRLNIVLNHISQLIINPAQSETTLTYNTTEDYLKGVELVKNEQLQVCSTSPYIVRAKLENENFELQGKEKGIRPGHINLLIGAEPSNQTAKSRAIYPTQLNTIERPIISSHVPTLNTFYDVLYKGPGNNELSTYVNQNNQVVLSNNVVFSIEPR